MDTSVHDLANRLAKRKLQITQRMSLISCIRLLVKGNESVYFDHILSLDRKQKSRWPINVSTWSGHTILWNCQHILWPVRQVRSPMSATTAKRFWILHPVHDKLALLKFIGSASSIVHENDHNYMRVIRNRQHPVTLSERNLMVLSGRV